MRMVDLIEKKKNGHCLSDEEIKYWIDGYVKGCIPDYQVSAMLMAICFQGMTIEETTQLTMAMMESGDQFDLSSIEGITVDKHSTGGVGDKTTLVLGPLVAACGVYMAKMSGRGLGFTGGTIDKLEAIKGFCTELSEKAFFEQVNTIGIALAGQSGHLVPADKKLYALRDVTGTVNSLPLIAASIMSKKLASGSQVIVLDVKYGKGAFMQTIEDAKNLAQLMISIGEMMGRKVRALITNMNQPLGFAIGNSLEVIEAIETLKGEGPEDLTMLCMEAGSCLLMEAGIYHEKSEAMNGLKDAILSGRALNKLIELVEYQGGNAEWIKKPELFPKAPFVTAVTASHAGYLQNIDALKIGHLSMLLGAGRKQKDDIIWPEVGIILKKKPGDFVHKGDVLLEAFHRMPLGDEWLIQAKEAYTIGEDYQTESLIAAIL